MFGKADADDLKRRVKHAEQTIGCGMKSQRRRNEIDERRCGPTRRSGKNDAARVIAGKRMLEVLMNRNGIDGVIWKFFRAQCSDPSAEVVAVQFARRTFEGDTNNFEAVGPGTGE